MDPRFQIKVEIDIREVAQMLATAPHKLTSTLKKMFKTTVTAIRMDMIGLHLTGGTSSTRLARRSGTLINSLKATVTGNTLSTLEGRVGFTWPGTKYASTHIYGTKSAGGELDDIYSKSGKYLPIPIYPGYAVTAGGRLRGGPRSGLFGDTFVQRSRKGNLIIFGRLRRIRGASAGETHGSIVPLFVLKRSVKVPARVDMLGVAEFHVRLLEQTAQTRLATALQRS